MRSRYIPLASPQPDRFVRLSSELLDALLRVHLSGMQWRILLWVLRNTYGWNRKTTRFSWYQIAKQLGGNRAVVWRAGQRLLQAHVLVLEDDQLGIQKEDDQWRVPGLASDGDRQLWMPGIDVAREQRQPLPRSNAIVAARQRKRGPEATLFRRVKDSSKDNLKTYKDKRLSESVAPRRRLQETTGGRETPLQQVLNHYIAFRAHTLTKEQTSGIYRRFGKAGKALLEACAQRVQEAQEAITRIGGHLNQARLSWTLETVHKWHCDPSLMRSRVPDGVEHGSAGAARPIPRKYDGISKN
jgi:phage replication O-like protein O